MMNFEKQPPNLLDSLSQQVLSRTPLHFACYAGDSEVVDLLLSKSRTYNNNHEAANACIAAMMIEEDGINGWTAAHWAAFYGQLNCLMKLHVQPNVGFDTPTEKSHISPLHLAAQSGAILCLKWLLQCGASINRQDFMGETPLHKAAKAGNTDSAAMLVSHGASLDLKNQRGCTPADLAELGNHPTLPPYLRKSKDPQTSGGQDKFAFPLPISDLNICVPFPSSLPPPHLPHPDHAKYNKFPYVNDLTVNKTLLHTRDTEESNIVMNGLPIGSVHSKLNHSDSDISESISSNSLRSCDDMDTLPSVYKLKRPLPSMKGTHIEEDESGVCDTHSPKRRCFGFGTGNEMENTFPEYSDACNNNTIPSCNVFPMKGFDTSCNSSSDVSHIKIQHSGPALTQSSVMEHWDTMSAEQGYDSSVMWAMHDVDTIY